MQRLRLFGVASLIVGCCQPMMGQHELATVATVVAIALAGTASGRLCRR
jgi:hypothetical protein